MRDGSDGRPAEQDRGSGLACWATRGLAAIGLALALALPAHADSDDRHVSLRYDKCLPNQVSLIGRAVEMAHAALERVIAELAALPPSKLARREVHKWFGVDTGTGRVLAIYRLIHKRMHPTAQPIIMICDLSQGLYGWTQAEQPGFAYIGFGRSFFRARLVGGFDTWMGTVVHEMSHMVTSIASDDHVYSTPEAEALALEKPEHALDNADNIEYFVEAIVTVRPVPGWPPATLLPRRQDAAAVSAPGREARQ